MAIVYNKDQNLAQGITSAGEALSQALTQASQIRYQRNKEAEQKKQFADLAKIVQDEGISENTMMKVLGAPGGADFIKAIAPMVGPMLKENARSQGRANYLRGMPGAGGQPSTPRPSSQPSAPAVPDNFYERNDLSEPPIDNAAEARSQQTGVPSISGIPSTPPLADENRVGPREQTDYQQGGQSGMDMNPPQENDRSFGTSQYTDEQITYLANSPYQEDRELARFLQQQQLPVQKEDAQIRKEERAEIRKYSEPYLDLQSLKSGVNKLDKAKDLIVNRKVSLDENQFRGLVNAILEDQDYSALAQYFKTDEQKQLYALMKDSFKTKEIGGSNPSTKEVLLTLATLPSERMGRGANIALINTLREDAIGRLAKGEAVAEIRKEGKRYNFGEFKDLVESASEQKLGPLRKEHERENIKAQYYHRIEGRSPPEGHVWAVSADGQIGSIPVSQIKKWEDNGGQVYERSK